MPATVIEPVALAASAPAAATPATRTPNLLLLTHRLPYPPDRGDRIRSYHLLRHLSERFGVAVACTSEEPVWLQHHQLLRTMADRVNIQPISPRWSKLRGAGAILSGSAITPAWHYRIGLAQSILQWHEQQPFDVVLTFCTGMIQYARLLADASLNHGHTPRQILDLVDVDSMKWDSYADQSWPPLSWLYRAEARRLRRIEAGRLDHFDAVTVISQAEANAYRQTVGDHAGLTVVRNGVDLEYFHPLPDPGNHTLVFVGVLNYRPNAQGIAWFAHKVMPLLRQRVPDAKLRIIGRHPTPAIGQLGMIAGVEVVGSVPDVRTYMAQASAVIAPLQIARGLQNKVLEAMACQRAVVCSPGAAQGIDARPDEHLLVADTPEQWAAQLQHVLENHDRRHTLAAAARQHVQQVYSWPQALAPMMELIERLTGGPA
ncbi:MAG: TIGR03087 family PEP-CTERM/XrtA system glycosyltransferase [Phycisphaeraceae bacterium]